MKKNNILRKLWIKNFILIFAIIILFIIIFIVEWQHTVMEYALKQEKKDIVQKQTDISEFLAQTVCLEKLNKGINVLSDKQLEDTVSFIFNDRKNNSSLFREDELVCGGYLENEIDSRFLEQTISENECLFQYIQISDVHYIQAVSAVMLQGQEYRIVTTTDISDLYQHRQELLKQMQFACIPFGIICLISFLILFFFLMEPLRKLNEAAKNAADGNYDEKLEIRRMDEIGELADNINKITQTARENINSLNELISQQKLFIEDLSNEISTPLTSILCYSEIILNTEQLPKEKLEDYAKTILFEGKQLKNLSERLTDFLYIGKINENDKTEISVKETIDNICNAMTPIFRKKRVYYTKRIYDFIMRVDLELFQTMLYNYLDNAITVSKENDIVEISVYQTKMQNIIEISDQSSDLDKQAEAEQTSSLEKRRSRLGMTLGQKIAAAHNGKVVVLDKQRRGTTVRIIFQQDGEIEL